MTKVSRVVLALFDDAEWAHHARDTLAAVGLARDEIGILEPRRRVPRRPGVQPVSDRRGLLRTRSRVGPRRQASPDSIAAAFVRRGMPADQAQYFEDQVRSGNSLLVVQTRGAVELAESVLHHFGAYDIRPFSGVATPAPNLQSRVGARSLPHGRLGQSKEQ